LARIPYITGEGADEEKSALLGLNPQLNIFKIAAHATHPVASAFIGLPASVLLNGTLDPILREMAIVRVGILCRSDYEVYQHRKVSKRVGMSAEKIAALEIGSSAPVFSELERMVLRFAEETVEHHKATDATFEALQRHLSHEQLVELAIAVGCYIMVSTFLNTFEIDIEDNPAAS